MSEKALFAAGCFWGVEAAFRLFLDKGIVSTRVGFAGGQADNPTYKEVVSGSTGHAETVEVIYDPDQISYAKLLDIFFQSHDPTQADGQGNDKGSSYRSIIFYTTASQKEEAQRQLQERADNYDKPITTELTPLTDFYEAEQYHQRYLEKNPGGYCHVNLSAIS